MVTRVAGATARRISSEQAAGLVTSGMWLDYGVSLCQPDVFDTSLAARKGDLVNVKIRSCLSMKPRAVLECDPEGEHFFMFSLHFSGYDRKQCDAGRCNYLPVNLGEIPDYYRRFIDPVDIVIIKTCPMDETGYFNFSAANLWHRAVIERAKMVIIEVTTGLPQVHGDKNGVHVSEVDYIIEGDNLPAPELPLIFTRLVASVVKGRPSTPGRLSIALRSALEPCTRRSNAIQTSVAIRSNTPTPPTSSCGMSA